jgi:hypothetical protein
LAAAGFCSFITTIPKGTTPMTDKPGQGKIADGRADPRSLKGIERRREIRAEDAAEVERIASHLLMTLNRPPSIAEELKAELIGRTACKIRRLAEQGRESLPERRLLEDLLRTPFNAPACTLGPKVEGSGQTYFVVTKGGDAAPDRAPISPVWPAAGLPQTDE